LAGGEGPSAGPEWGVEKQRPVQRRDNGGIWPWGRKSGPLEWGGGDLGRCQATLSYNECKTRAAERKVMEGRTYRVGKRGESRMPRGEARRAKRNNHPGCRGANRQEQEGRDLTTLRGRSRREQWGQKLMQPLAGVNGFRVYRDRDDAGERLIRKV